MYFVYFTRSSRFSFIRRFEIRFVKSVYYSWWICKRNHRLYVWYKFIQIDLQINFKFNFLAKYHSSIAIVWEYEYPHQDVSAAISNTRAMLYQIYRNVCLRLEFVSPIQHCCSCYKWYLLIISTDFWFFIESGGVRCFKMHCLP